MPENYNALYSNSILMSDKGGRIGGITYLFTKNAPPQAPQIRSFTVSSQRPGTATATPVKTPEQKNVKGVKSS
ncbi:hypothetical protein IQ265_17890 [Nodosilinea sp. LEGE 06152]|uniref:hypothetical protein n=1 Tax=Nodosilinea sp. LEGE 06152 TaxID=2777966 RepID=UPI00187E6CFC|nr:hypothetical protein [Nodosilinea sp. LEGE 06152]MBE9158689.1 hypothetical protein [Nodosilinea sp. LEGE 06152]